MPTKTTRDYVNVWRTFEVDGHTYHVNAYSILTTDDVVVDAYECTKHIGDRGYTHSTLTSRDVAYGRLGKVTTRRLPAEIDALSYGDNHRVVSVQIYQSQRDRIAHQAIQGAFGDLDSLELKAGGYGTITLGAFHTEARS